MSFGLAALLGAHPKSVRLSIKRKSFLLLRGLPPNVSKTEYKVSVYELATISDKRRSRCVSLRSDLYLRGYNTIPWRFGDYGAYIDAFICDSST